MAYPLDLAAHLSGATKHQLRSWSRNGILVPEVSPRKPMLYSFRDLVALRSFAHLRSHASMQSIRKALGTLSDFQLAEHPSEYKFATDGKSVKVWTDEGYMDVVRNPGQYELKSLADIYKPFLNFRGRRVPDLRNPNDHVSVDPRRLGGWPTVAGTRVPYDAVADLLAEGDVPIDEVSDYYPTVAPSAVADIIAFHRDVHGEAA